MPVLLMMKKPPFGVREFGLGRPCVAKFGGFRGRVQQSVKVQPKENVERNKNILPPRTYRVAGCQAAVAAVQPQAVIKDL